MTEINQVESCFSFKILIDTQHFFDKVCPIYNSPPISVKKLLKKEDGSLKKGDFSLSLFPNKYPNLACNLPKIAESLMLEVKYLEQCKVSEFRIEMKLNRGLAYSHVLQLADTFRSSFGFNTSCSSPPVLLLVSNEDALCLTGLRTNILAEHITAILLANGFRVYCKEGILENTLCLPNQKNLILYSCQKCNLKQAYTDFENKVLVSKFLLSHSDKVQLFKSGAEELMILNGIQYLKEVQEIDKDLYKNIGYIHLQKETFTNCLQWCSKANHVLETHATDTFIVLILMPPNHKHLMQQCSLVLKMLDNKLVKHLLMVHHQVLDKDLNNLTSEAYVKQVRQSTKKSLLHKYGKDSSIDEKWISVMQMLTETIIKFDFLSTGSSVPIKINSASNIKQSTFVQYNCARLFTILGQFEKRVSCGKYKDIPHIKDIDFSSLSQDEWNLFFNYIIPFPKIIHDLAEKITVDESNQIAISTQVICQLLIKLSQDLSGYYHKHRILVEPHPQLLSRMYPRVYLFQALFQVMKNSLALLNLLPIEKM